MAAFFVPPVHLIENINQATKVFNVGFLDRTIRVTYTNSPDVADEWIADFNPIHQSYFPAGVAVHTEGAAGQLAHVLTISIGEQCLIFQLFRGQLSRQVKVFLRDVCTSYGWRTSAYADLLRPSRVYLGRLTDIETISHHRSLGEFSVMVLGRLVHEPTADWRTVKKTQIRETVTEAYICQLTALMTPHEHPANTSLTRVVYSTFPQITEPTVWEDRTGYQVFIGDDSWLNVVYSKRGSVLIGWLRRLETTTGLIGFDLNQDHLGRNTIMALASGQDCMVFDMHRGGNFGSIIASSVFEMFLNTPCPFVGWNTGDSGDRIERLGLGIRPGRVLDVKEEFPETHSYDDLARLVLGYEMPKLSMVRNEPEAAEIMRVAVQAYACLRGGITFGYENRAWE